MQFGVLGPLAVRRADGEGIAVGGPRPRALLAMLLLDAGRLVSLERLIDGQYGDRPPSGAANAVQAQVSRLRRQLPAGLIESHGTGYRLAAERDAVDAHRFERLAREGRGLLAAGRHAQAARVLRAALRLWRGPAFADVADAPFAGPQVVRLEELRLAATEDLHEAELSLPDAGPSAGLRELVTAHPLRERARGLLMRALHAAGRQAEALAAYEEGRRLLADELGADPSPELAALHLEILRGSSSPERPARAVLPAQLTSFVGREEELSRLAVLRAARLVTIVGPGGTGKTRLAIEAATRYPPATVVPSHDGGGVAPAAGPVAFVDLSLVDAPTDTRTGAQVVQVVLGALGLREPALRPAAGGPEPVERVVAALAGQELLLVLDNCEHVVGEAATLARRLLAQCPGLTVLATSREPLGITGEHLVPLSPLPTPPPGADDPLAYPAVRLFVDRAAAVRQGFALGEHNLEAVLRICAALDGLPLAIELAAARVRTFGVAEIADRLAEHGRFRLLSRGDRTAAARHQTLHAVVEWSWSLLGPEEQALARRLSVFTGGATLEAVEHVCRDDDGKGEDPAGVLADLVDKSLVETDGERYQMLDTIRLFCLERLAEAGEEERLRRAHAAWFLDLAGRAHEHLYRAEQLTWLASLSADNANLQSALRWSVRHDRPTAWRLVGTLGMYWWLTGRRGQAVRHAERLLDAAGAEVPAGLAEEYVLAVLHAVPGTGSPHWERAKRIVGALDRPMRYQFGVALWGMLAGPPEGGLPAARKRWAIRNDPWSRALDRLGVALMTLHDGLLTEAETRMEQVLADFGALGERWGMGQALDWLALIASWRGDWRRAMELWERALALFAELGALDELADVLSRRGNAHWRAGDAEAARADNERAGELERRLGRPELMAWVQLQLGDISRLQGDLPAAARRLDAALSGSGTGAFTAGGTRSRVFTALGRLAAARGDAEEAGRMHAEALAGALGSPLASDVAEVAEGLAGHALFQATHSMVPAAPELGPGSGAPKRREAGARRAAVLLGIGAAVRGMAVAGDRDVAATAAGATRVLGPEAFAAAYAKGAAMSREEALTTLRAAIDR
ncbi:BTAD domain-containing putative transcriptional regulator [Nonomuraea gerenzanensis]|uniref:Signal transduction response regulator n=1 Tax=Nonomuraea gerenzanensis TaxID=93944 RepID=A0A1M4DW14_9ACTN|nr:BTAD domain-containing putative transcriptional regulator [Nonomuraea gerenzanensis]SBO90762.1 Signal transduction response regulator [Nonomuraea gerenzanensis]